MPRHTPPTDPGPVLTWLSILLFAVAMALHLAAATGCSQRRYHLRLPDQRTSS